MDARGPAPAMPAWQLALRFGLELAALVAVGRWAASWPLPLAWRWVLGFAAPGALALLWGSFAVPGDPSRSGQAPIAVPGALRLLLELAVFGAGALALYATGDIAELAVDLIALAVHHAGTVPRLRWLLSA
jgi:hypothetical protein